MGKVFTKLYPGDAVATNGLRALRKLTTKETAVAPGLYNTSGNLIASWDTLINEYGLNIGRYYSSDSTHNNYYKVATSSPYYILNNYPELTKGTRLVIPDVTINVVDELPTRDIDPNRFYSLNGVLYRYEETGNNDSLLGTWLFNKSTTYDWGDLIGQNYLTFYDQTIDRLYYGFYKEAPGNSYQDYCYFYTEEDYSESELVRTLDYSLGGGDGGMSGPFERSNKLRGHKIVITSVQNITDEGLYWWKALAEKIANEYSWVAYDPTQVDIPNTATHIYDYAFYDCSGLTSITIPANVTNIGSCAFLRCFSLIEVCNKSSLDITAGSSYYGDIGYYAKQIIVDEAQSVVKYVGGHAFFDDGTDVYLIKYLGDIIAPPDYKGKTYEIYQYASYNNPNLTEVVIGSNITTIGANAFGMCTGLKSIAIPDNVTKINEAAFSGCTSLTDVIIGSGVTTIDTKAFSGCVSLKSIAIPDNVTKINEAAFSGCTSLTDVIIGSGVTTIAYDAFKSGNTITLYINSNKLSSIKFTPTLEMNIYFNGYSEDTEILFDLTNFLAVGSKQKGTYTYSIYTDNSKISEASLALLDEYTLVTVYHLDGTDWSE